VKEKVGFVQTVLRRWIEEWNLLLKRHLGISQSISAR
jgi:hypothetical protein